MSARVRGQALVELLVAAAVLTAFVVGIVVLGRLQDLQGTLVQASRYAALERAYSGAADLGRIAGEMRARLFDGAERPITASDRSRSAERWLDANPHWVDWSRRANPLVARPADVTLVLEEAPPPGGAARALNTTTGAFDAAGAVSGGRLDLERRGYHSATVSVAVQPLGTTPPLDRLRLTLTDRATLLGDDWSARHPAEVASRTAALAPGARLASLRPVLAPVRAAASLVEPAFRDLCPGRIDPEVVPADRLGAPGSGPDGSWVAPC